MTPSPSIESTLKKATSPHTSAARRLRKSLISRFCRCRLASAADTVAFPQSSFQGALYLAHRLEPSSAKLVSPALTIPIGRQQVAKHMINNGLVRKAGQSRLP